MINNIKGMLLLFTLCILCMGIVSASDVESDDTTGTDTSVSQQTTAPAETVDDADDTVINDNSKTIRKNNEKAVKTASGKIKTEIHISDVIAGSVDDVSLLVGNLWDAYSNPIRYANLTLTGDGGSFYTKTNEMGVFSFNYHDKTPGTKTVKVSYSGNSKYAASSAKRTFTVRGQYQTRIVLNNIKDVNIGDKVTVSGHYYYEQSKPLRQTSMLVNVNGQETYAKTDSNGYFKYTYTTDKAGTNKVTISYPGNSKFAPASVTKTFKTIGPQTTYITLNSIPETNFGNTVTISGYYTYAQSKPLKQTSMLVNVNGRKAYAKTDNNGYFRYSYKTTLIGTNKVTVSYAGNSRFQAASTTKTFNVKTTGPITTYITLNGISNTDLGNTVTISGYYTYGQSQPLRQTSMLINVNGQKAYAKTDNNGYFRYSYKTTKSGTNTVTVSYAGNSMFKAAVASKTFAVKDTTKVVTMYFGKNDYVWKYVDHDPFVISYSTEVNSQNGRGVLVELDSRGLKYPPINTILKAKFYFKNSAGKIITRVDYADEYSSPSTSWINGYKPYKVDITYRKMTAEERNNYW